MEMIRTFVDRKNGDVYRIDFRKGWLSGGYTMYCLSHPPCPYPLEYAAHLLPHDRICVAAGREPRSIEQAKAIALHWMRGFSTYARTGIFPNGPARVNVAES
jgi:hypothetical protein